MDRRSPRTGVDDQAAKIYLVGGGIASMSAAAFLIRDGDVIGKNITILEERGVVGGSLDGSGSADKGYVLRAAACSRANTSALSNCFPRFPRSPEAKPSRRRYWRGTRP
jgi:oleate hydratase